MYKLHKAYAQIVLAAILWSTAGIFMKQIHIHPFSIAGLRSLIAALFMLAYIFLSKQRLFFNRKIALAGIFLCGTFLSFVCANKLTTAANAIVLQYSAPIFIVAISAIFLKQKINRPDIPAVLLTFVGIIIFFFDQVSSGAMLGNGLAVAAGVFLALMYITLGTVDPQEKMSALLFGHLLTALVGTPATFFLPFAPSATAWGYLILLGIVQIAIPYILVAKASHFASPLACSLIGVIEPLLNPIWVAVFDGETPGIFALIGSIIILTSVTLWCCMSGRKPE